MQLHGWEAVLFYLLAIMTLFMAVFVVTARVTIHSALFLIGTLVNIALLFILLRAEFVAGVQILVYVGGVMVLFLFVIMLVQTRAEEEARVALYTGQTWPAVVIALLLAVSFYFAMNPAQAAFRPPESSCCRGGGGRKRRDQQGGRGLRFERHSGGGRATLPPGGAPLRSGLVAASGGDGRRGVARARRQAAEVL